MPTLYVNVSMPDRCVDSAVNAQGVIGEADHTAIKYGSVSGSCPIEKDRFLDSVIMFIGLSRDCRTVRRF